MFILADSKTGKVGAMLREKPPGKPTPEKKSLIDSGWKWVEVKGSVPEYESLEDLNYEGDGKLSERGYPKYNDIRVRNDKDVDRVTGQNIERVVSIGDELKEIRLALSALGKEIPSHKAIEKEIKAGKKIKEVHGW